jgi:hypothetical protein
MVQMTVCDVNVQQNALLHIGELMTFFMDAQLFELINPLVVVFQAITTHQGLVDAKQWTAQFPKLPLPYQAMGQADAHMLIGLELLHKKPESPFFSYSTYHF